MTQELFDRFTEWQRKTFTEATPLSKLHHLREEVDETIEAIRRESLDKNIRLEYADCFLLLYGSAAFYGMSLDDISMAVKEKMEINDKREWGVPDNNGVVNHIKDDNSNEL